jgi:hypothetical protein
MVVIKGGEGSRAAMKDAICGSGADLFGGRSHPLVSVNQQFIAGVD